MEFLLIARGAARKGQFGDFTGKDGFIRSAQYFRDLTQA
jgi:hypothetical protein